MIEDDKLFLKLIEEIHTLTHNHTPKSFMCALTNWWLFVIYLFTLLFFLLTAAVAVAISDRVQSAGNLEFLRTLAANKIYLLQ